MRPLAYLVVAVLFALTIGSVLFAVDAAVGLDNGLLEDTRTPVPGSKVLSLEKRKYNLFFEADELHGSEPTVPVRVLPLESDHPLDLEDYSGSFTISGSRDAAAFATVRIPETGRYRVVVSGHAPGDFTEPAVVLGEPVRGRIGRIVGGVFVAVAFFMAGVTLLVVTLVRRSRRRA